MSLRDRKPPSTLAVDMFFGACVVVTLGALFAVLILVVYVNQ